MGPVQVTVAKDKVVIELWSVWWVQSYDLGSFFELWLWHVMDVDVNMLVTFRIDWQTNPRVDAADQVGVVDQRERRVQ